jgi:tetratricopeptide (TPR) repeat protein
LGVRHWALGVRLQIENWQLSICNCLGPAAAGWRVMGRFARLDFHEKPTVAPPLEDPWPDMDEGRCLEAAAEQFDRGLYEAALRFYSRALGFNKELSAAWVGQVRCLICLDEYREAVLWATRGLERFRDDPELLACRGLALVRSGKVAEGMEYVDGAIEQRSPSAWVWLARGAALLAAGQPEVNARRCFLKARELAPEDGRVALRTGMAYVEARRFAEAREPLLRARQRMDSNPLLLYTLGRTYEGAGEWKLAEGCYERAVTSRAEFTEAVEALHRVRSGNPIGRVWGRLWDRVRRKG